MKAAQEKHGKATHELQDTEIKLLSITQRSFSSLYLVDAAAVVSKVPSPLWWARQSEVRHVAAWEHLCPAIRSVGMWVIIYKARWWYSNIIVTILASYSKPEENGENYSIKKQRHPCRLWEVYWWCHWWPMSGLANMLMSFFEKKPVCPPYICTESNPWQVMGVCACWCLHKSAFVLSSSWTYHSKGHSLWTLGQRMLHFRVVVSTVATGAVTTCKYPSFDDPWA